MSAEIIYDVGMNNGDDTAYYLSRGHRVVAIEANPLLAREVAVRFHTEIAAGRLVARAVAEPRPSTELFAAWHNRHVGKAMEWFIEQLGDGAVRAGLLG